MNKVAQTKRKEITLRNDLPVWRGLKEAFLKVIGENAIDDLVKKFPPSTDERIVVSLSGDQATGKGTVGEVLASVYGGMASGTGTIVRQAAKAAKQEIQDYTKTIPDEVDAQLDYRATTVIAEGGLRSQDDPKFLQKCSAFDGRMAAYACALLRELGRQNIVSVYLTASPRERALRYVNREISPEARTELEDILRKKFGANKNLSFSQIMDQVEHLTCPGVNARSEAGKKILESRDKVFQNRANIEARDKNDRERLRKLYGIDYADTSVYDIIVNTDGKTPEEVQEEVLSRVEKKLAELKAHNTKR